jgi:cyclase
MLTNRVIACFDIIGDRVTKALRFQNNVDVADARELAASMYEQGVDEIIFYDITASHERRTADPRVVKDVASRIFVPFTVGGGIASVRSMHDVLDAGAEKISIDSMAVRNPELITEGAREFGCQCIVVSMQVRRTDRTETLPSGYEVMIDGARTSTGMDAVDWARRVESLGAGEICVNSIDRDGTGNGFDIRVTRDVASAVRLPVIASGGAGSIQHVADVFAQTGATAAIVSSLLYSPVRQTYAVADIKSTLARSGFPMRPAIEPYRL